MFFKYIKSTILYLLLSPLIVKSKLCTYTSELKYQNLINKHPNLESELKTMSNYPIPVWYTDRDVNSINSVKETIHHCDKSTSIIVVYGLPNKDCSEIESSQGFNKNSEDYIKFITNLHDQVSDKEVIYILEPDALSLSMPNKCGLNNKYIDNSKEALKILSQNKNAKIYLDIGYWILIYDDQKIKDFLNIVNQIDTGNKIKGFSLNIANYRSNGESIDSCKRIRDISGKDYKCIIDTSRNANGPSIDSTWCNLNSAGIGNVPTDNTGVSFIDYFLWIKPAIEVDGHCSSSPNSFKSSNSAGSVDIDYFKKLWDQGSLKNLQKNKQNLNLRCGH